MQAVEKGHLADVYPATVNGTHRHKLYELMRNAFLSRRLAQCSSTTDAGAIGKPGQVWVAFRGIRGISKGIYGDVRGMLTEC